MKYGFHYAEREDWGRFRRLFEHALRAQERERGPRGARALRDRAVQRPRSSASTSPSRSSSPRCCRCSSSPEGSPARRSSFAAATTSARGFLFVSMGLRLDALVVGTQYGVTRDRGRASSSRRSWRRRRSARWGSRRFRRFPRVEPVPLGEDRRGILRFVFQSSLATGVVSLRGWISHRCCSASSRTVAQVGLFRTAQAPQQGLASLSAPVRLILLTEQTRRLGARARPRPCFAGVRRYSVGAALLMVVIVPPVFVLMPWLVRSSSGADYEDAGDAARLVLLAARAPVRLGWSKSLPVSIGRPSLRVARARRSRRSC